MIKLFIRFFLNILFGFNVSTCDFLYILKAPFYTGIYSLSKWIAVFFLFSENRILYSTKCLKSKHCIVVAVVIDINVNLNLNQKLKKEISVFIAFYSYVIFRKKCAKKKTLLILHMCVKYLCIYRIFVLVIVEIFCRCCFHLLYNSFFNNNVYCIPWLYEIQMCLLFTDWFQNKNERNYMGWRCIVFQY